MLSSPVLYVAVLVFIATVIDAQDCAYNETEADRTGRRCNRDAACSDLKKCKGKRRCRCDDICGTICIQVFRDNYCDVTDLGDLTVALSVEYSDERIRFETNATYSCSPGYKFSDESLSIRRCRGDERWSGETPTCITDVACGEPPSVKYAIHNGTDASGDDRLIYGIKERLKYTCGYGYYPRQGSPYITCKLDEFNSSLANWTEVDPTLECSPVSCGSPGTVLNGKRNGNLFSFGNTVTFECNTGYELSGRSYRTCQSTAEWDGRVPSCNPIRCPTIQEPQDGTLFGTSYTYRSKISIDCSTGFVVSGTDSQSIRVTCQADKTWSHSPQTCEAVDCGNPGTPMNGSRNGDSFGYQGYVLFSCDDAFRLEGIRSIYCGADNSWSASIPRCIGQCILPDVPENLNRISQYLPREIVDEGTEYLISCEDGYTLNSDTNRWICLATGRMSFNPVCIEDPCEKLQDIENGEAEYTGQENEDGLYLPRTIATYYCDEGYALDEGVSTRTCRKGRFTGEEATCTITTCDVSTILNGYPVGLPGTVDHGMNIMYKCNAGYHMEGLSVVQCWNETLHPVPPMCLENPCSEVPDISNGTAEYDRLKDVDGMLPPRTTVTYQCSEGYKFTSGSDQMRTCVEGRFTGSDLECLLTSCDILSINNGRAIGNSGTIYHGTTVGFSCDNGYESKDALNVVCWNETLIPHVPKCTEKPCQEISKDVDISYDRDQIDESYPAGTVARYEVRETVENNNSVKATRICSTTATCHLGNFTEETECIMTCHRYEVAYADVRYTKDEHHVNSDELLPGVQRAIKCHNPYRMNNDDLSESVCRSNGHWSKRSPSCEKECTVLGPPKYGRVTSDTLPGSKVKSKTVVSECNSNYEMVGNAFNECNFTVVQQPQCIAKNEHIKNKYCPLLKNKKFGWYSYSDSLREGSVVRFACTHQYVSSIPAFQRECKRLEDGPVRYVWFPEIMEEPVCSKVSRCHYDILFARGKKIGQISASSFLNNKEPKYYGWNIHGVTEWRPSSTDQEPWLQIQYDDVKTIYGVIVRSNRHEWVTLYSVKYRSGNGTWNFVKNIHDTDAVFLGNINRKTSLIETFPQEVNATALRVYPLDSHDGIALKITFLDCPHIDTVVTENIEF